MKDKLILFLLFVIFPLNVFAYDFTCDSGTYRNGDSFNCVITDDNIKTYDSISGDITVPDVLSCSIDKTYLEGNSGGTSFNLRGSASGKNILSVKCKVAKEIEDNIKAQLTIDNFKYSVSGNTGEEKLRSSLINLDKRKEVSSTTTTKNRSILNGNSLLKSVESDTEFTFSKYITEYDIQVLYSVKEVNFTFEKAVNSASVILDTKDSVTITNNKVRVELEDVGVQSFDLIVRSDDGGETVYTFNVERLEKGEGLYDRNKDATLSKLTLGNYKISFDSKIYNYILKVDSSVESISVSATPTVDGALVVVSNNTNIKDGTNITVSVTALDGTTKQDYIIKIEKSVNYSLLINSIVIGVLSILIIILVICLIKTLNKKNKDDPVYKYKMKQKNQNINK